MVRLLLLLLVTGYAAEVAASGGISPEMGTRKTGTGAIIGRADDLSAIYHNPAGLILSPKTNIFFNGGVHFLGLDIKLKPWAGAERYIDAPVNPDGYYDPAEATLSIAAVPMLVGSTSFLDDRLVVALGAYVPNAIGAAFAEDDTTRYHVIQSYAITGSITAAAAYRLCKQFTVGLGVNALYMRIHSKRKLFPVLDGMDLSGLFGGNSEMEINGAGWGASVSLGLMWEPTPWMSIGAVMISRADLKLSGDVRLEFGPDALGEGALEGTQKTTYTMPWVMQGGINMDLTPWLELAFELRYYAFREIKEQVADVEGVDVIDQLVIPRNFTDSYHLGGGVRIHPKLFRGVELMLGGHYDQTPALDDFVSVDQPLLGHSGIRMGVRYAFANSFRAAMTYVHYWYVPVQAEASQSIPPTNFYGSGGNNIVSLMVEGRFGGEGW